MFFVFNDPATTEIYTLSLHDALPIFAGERDIPEPALREDVEADVALRPAREAARPAEVGEDGHLAQADRKSTRLNSSHMSISYAVFCLKKKKKTHSTATLVTMLHKRC